MTCDINAMNTFRREAGMSLVELMVGMAIGLIGIVIITHLYLTNEQYKRSTTGAGTAQANGAVALYTLEREIRMAGYGFNTSGALGCSCATAGCSPIQYYYNGAYSNPPGSGSGTRPPIALAPVVITETAGQPDQISILYSAVDQRALPTTLAETMPGPSAELVTNGTLGYQTGDLVVVANGSSCVMMQITQVQDSASHIQHNPGTSLWNPAGGGNLLPSFPAGSYVFDLGTPTWRIFSVANSSLQVAEVLQNITSGATPFSLIDNIVDLQAQYGKDTNSDGKVDTWDTVSPTTGAGWLQVIAVRVGVLAQSPNYLKPSTAGGACDATVSAPTWAGGTFTTLDFATTTSEARCYKYRVFDTIVPLRNIIWSPG